MGYLPSSIINITGFIQTDMMKKPYKPSLFLTLLRSKNALAGSVIVSLFFLCAAFAPVITVHDPYLITIDQKELAPSANHIFGTDNLGRDVYSRVVYGSRISLRVGILAMAVSLFIGIILGSVSGYFGGLTDNLIMRVTDIFM